MQILSFEQRAASLGSDVKDFVDSLMKMCYFVGGEDLIRQVDEEFQFRYTDGEDFFIIVKDIFERVRSRAIDKALCL